MLQLEGPHEAEDVQGHLGNVYCMSVAISHGQTTGHHVGITDGFYLWGHFLINGSALNADMDRGWEFSMSTILSTSFRTSSLAVSPGVVFCFCFFLVV